ncbi:MAG: ATP synthase F1 subunit gamma [Planctomycetes bacterium]|nr:ATP synthase F1 subunit gamma [Planctomycetota bacterium]
MLGIRKIKRKIRSVNNIKKITRAMEMVSASKLKKAQEKLNAIRPFSAKLQSIMDNILATLPPELMTHKLLHRETAENRIVSRIGLVAIASGKGLCGGYNANLLRTVSRFMNENANAIFKITAIGKKTMDYFQKTNRNVFKSYHQIPPNIDSGMSREIITPFMRDFEKGAIDEVWIVYTEYVNAMVYRPKVMRLVPFLSEGANGKKSKETKPQLAPYGDSLSPRRNGGEQWSGGMGYLFEPDPNAMLDVLVPRYIEMTFYRLLLDALSSEHSARMIAMRNATDNANEVMDELTLIFNKARQSSITKELLDIVSGAEAMK